MPAETAAVTSRLQFPCSIAVRFGSSQFAIGTRCAACTLASARIVSFVTGRLDLSLSSEAHIDQLRQGASAATPALADEEVAKFLRAVGDGRVDEVRASLTADRRFVNAIGPHPYWGGRPQALHVSIETRRRDVFDMLLAVGADINGSNDQS